MPDTVPVTIEVDPAAAAALDDPATRARIGRLVSRVLGSREGERLAAIMDSPGAGADQGAAEGRALAAEFRAFRRGRTLGGLDPRALIREGQR